MNLHILVRLFVVIFALAVIPIAAQVDQTAEAQALEEDFIRTKVENGESHASGARDDLGPVILGNPTQAAVAIRVGLSYSVPSEFSTRHHPFAEISHTAGTVYLIDRGTGQDVAVLDVPGTIVRVQRFNDSGYHVSIGGVEIGTYAGPLHFVPTDTANLFRIEHIRRTYNGVTDVPSYRGMIELSNAAGTSPDRLHVVNIVEIEDYVPGVVANESIASFHMEALKAQAVAARGYAIANIGRFRANFPYDIDDSSQSQVYRGVISEHVRAVEASSKTIGLVGSYNGTIIQALYSSSFGGHSDSNEWSFGSAPVPYLRAIYDGEGAPLDLTDPATRDLFWSTIQPQGYDMCGRVNNRFARWRLDIPAATIKSRLVNRSVVISGNTSGTITDVQVPVRMTASNRVSTARVILTTGVVEVRGRVNLQGVFGTSVASTTATCPNSSNIAAGFGLTNPALITPYTNASGQFAGVIAQGGGWGHNTGMSQYGAHGRALAQQTFLQILKAYYTGIDVGSYPIRIGREPGSGPPTLKQEFYAPNALGTLEIRNATFKGLIVHINDHDIVLRKEELADGAESIDLSPYLQTGLNLIHYSVVGRNGSATVNVNVE